MSKIKISMTIEQDIYQAFKEYCRRNGMKISTKVELLMKDATQNTTLTKFIK